MPNGVVWTDVRDIVRAKLGQPNDSNEVFKWDEWQRDGYIIAAEYRGEPFNLAMLQLIYKQ